MLFHQWRDFITYPLDSGRVRSREERLDTRHAVRPEADGCPPPGYSPFEAIVFTQPAIVHGTDAFECMEVDDSGHVTIWTRERLWFLAREGEHSRIEKMRYYPRHPPRPPGTTIVSSKCEEIVLHILHWGLISSRNLASRPKRTAEDNLCLAEWTELCHSMPSILLGQCSPDSLDYFIRFNAPRFRQGYPRKNDPDFVEVCKLLDELAALIGNPRPPSKYPART